MSFHTEVFSYQSKSDQSAQNEKKQILYLNQQKA